MTGLDNTIGVFRQKLEHKKGQQAQLNKDLKIAQITEEGITAAMADSEMAQAIIILVAQKTQGELEYRLSEIVSLALAAVFEDAYKLKVNFVIQRGKTECVLLFERDKMLLDPLFSSGIGAVDVAAFGLKIAIWSLTQPKTRNVLILDEPFKHLKGLEENKKVIQMIKTLSKKLNLQIIMVHDERVPLAEIEKGTDRIFSVTKPGKHSVIEKIK